MEHRRDEYFLPLSILPTTKPIQPGRRGCAEAHPYRLERNIFQFVRLGRLQPHQSLHDLPAGGLAHAALEDWKMSPLVERWT